MQILVNVNHPTNVDLFKKARARNPIDNLKQAGVDLTTKQPMEHAFRYIIGLVDRLQALPTNYATRHDYPGTYDDLKIDRTRINCDPKWPDF